MATDDLKRIRGRRKSDIVGDIAKESLGLGVAEFASIATSLGVVAVADDLAPGLIKYASKAISKTCVEPFLDYWEGGLKTICKLEDCQPDLTKSREERAERLAHTIVVFSSAWAASMAAKLAVRKLSNNMTDLNHHKEPVTGDWFKDKVLYRYLNKHDWAVLSADEGIHLGSLILVNRIVPKNTDDLIRGTSGILQKTLGWSKKRADNVASMGIIWEVPNVMGWLAGVGMIARSHLSKSATSRLESLSSHSSLSGPDRTL
jgi:hypothetical protein